MSTDEIKDVHGKYNLRVLLTIVDIENHQEPLKELSKTSLVNNWLCAGQRKKRDGIWSCIIATSMRVRRRLKHGSLRSGMIRL